MSHLGEKVSSLVDGQLSADAAERAHMHITGCADCRQAVEVERLMKQRLRVLGMPAPADELVARLLHLAGPAGPLPPRPGHVPGNPRPQFVKPGSGTGRVLRTRPLGRRPSSRPPATARPGLGRNRMAAAMVGAACLVGAGVAGSAVTGPAGVADQRVVPAFDSFVVQHVATTSDLPFSDQTVLWKPVVGAGR